MTDNQARPSYAALTKALCQARSKLSGTVFKSGMNQHQRYAYVGHEQVVRSGAREALGECGLALVQTNVELVSDAVPAGKVQAHLYRGEFLLLHESGESLPLTFLATVQPNDKSAFVASTSLDRVALLRLLCLAGSSDEDPESDWHDQQTQRDQHARSGATPGQLNNQPGQAAPPPIDGAVLKLISELELATADKLDGLLASARGMFRSVFPDERKALQDAVEFAKARVQKAQDETAAAAAQGGAA
jgi:hypothetical protein